MPKGNWLTKAERKADACPRKLNSSSDPASFRRVDGKIDLTGRAQPDTPTGKVASPGCSLRERALIEGYTLPQLRIIIAAEEEYDDDEEEEVDTAEAIDATFGPLVAEAARVAAQDEILTAPAAPVEHVTAPTASTIRMVVPVASTPTSSRANVANAGPTARKPSPAGLDQAVRISTPTIGTCADVEKTAILAGNPTAARKPARIIPAVPLQEHIDALRDWGW